MKKAGVKTMIKAFIWFLVNCKLYFLSLNSFAIARAVKALTNSDGWRPIAPKLYQDVAPLIVLPKTNKPISDAIEIK